MVCICPDKEFGRLFPQGLGTLLEAMERAANQVVVYTMFQLRTLDHLACEDFDFLKYIVEI